MPRPSKRIAASRRGGKMSALNRALKRQEMESSTDLEVTTGSSLEIPGASQTGIEADVLPVAPDAPRDDELQLGGKEDRHPTTSIRQPAAGRKPAIINKEEIKRRREEKKALGIGISVSRESCDGPKSRLGDITAFLKPRVSASASPGTSEPVPVPSESAPSANWTAPTLIAQADQSTEQSLVPPSVAPNFEGAFPDF
ncbi:hypothetical protein V8E54_000287 [Elaphomyces granulatus]